jgi:HlyD family secretion protein
VVKKKVIIGVVVGVVVVVFILANLLGKREPSVDVETEVVAKQDLKALVTASGQIQPKKSVNVSANTMGKIVELAVAEGDSVEKGQLLVRIDPRGPESIKAQASAGLRAAEANLELYKANLTEAKADKERIEKLHARDLASDQQMITARTAYEVAVANVTAARGDVARQQAALSSADYELSKVTIHAEISGVVTRLNVEEGENVVTGTMNNAGTVLMTISDLSHMEAEVLVDETDVVDVFVGLEAEVTIDAFPDTTFKGRVTEVGHSAIVSAGSFGREESADFEVKVALLDPLINARPGLSASADIVTAVRDSVPSIPIQALTIRPYDKKKGAGAAGGDAESGDDEGSGEGSDQDSGETSEESSGEDESEGASSKSKGEKEELQGVFVVEDGRAVFKPCKVGIAGEKHFEVVSGLEIGEEVIKGPFKTLRKLRDGAKVEAKKTSESDEE